ncbi:hypothetical protein EDD11_003311 [Mortierella claussenii]|nr:hypothetical protein EDD11_003311 [Mortierella claussenii]
MQQADQASPTRERSPGSPPAIYVADAIARSLLPIGPELFNRKTDANCILLTGTMRFYVHVQMLASRSPTFRKIFDEMIMSKVWGTDDSTTTSSEDDDDDDDDDGSNRSSRRNSISSEDDQEQLQHRNESFLFQTKIRASTGVRPDNGDQDFEADADVEDDSDSDDHEVGGHESMDEGEPNGYGTSTVSGSLHFQSQNDDDLRQKHLNAQSYDSESRESDADESLPELMLPLKDPEGSRFEEMLYWLYTDDAPRWLRSFTPRNYLDILDNIRTLNICTPAVLEICRTFERSLDSNEGMDLRGQADNLFRQQAMVKDHNNNNNSNNNSNNNNNNNNNNKNNNNNHNNNKAVWTI